jgi:hypothetical protein
VGRLKTHAEPTQHAGTKRGGNVAKEYLSTMPEALPASGRVLVHNQVYPVARRPGTRGSRCWLQAADDSLEPCD